MWGKLKCSELYQWACIKDVAKQCPKSQQVMLAGLCLLGLAGISEGLHSVTCQLFGGPHHNIVDSSAQVVPYKYDVRRRLPASVGNRVSNDQHNSINTQELTASRGCLYSCYTYIFYANI